MNPNDLLSLKNRFAGYCASFSMPAGEDQRNISVKQEHTLQVCLNALLIGRDLKLGEDDLLLAETIALFHDIGRFPQYHRHQTFDDSISVNHAALGARVLVEENMLQDLPKPEQDLIIHCVALHNVFSLPDVLDEWTRMFARLVRDADKLDVLRVVMEYFGHGRADRADAVALGLPDAPGYSPEILACLVKGELARKSALTTQNDLKLLLLSWLYDINFTSSLRIVLERSYIDRIGRLLPDDPEFRQAVGMVRAYVERRLRAE